MFTVGGKRVQCTKDAASCVNIKTEDDGGRRNARHVEQPHDVDVW